MKVGFGSFLDEEVARPAKEEPFWSTGQAGVEGWMDQLATPLVGGDKRLPPPEADFHKEAVLADELPIKVVCSYCKKVMKEGTEPVSHGACDPCKEAALDEFRRRRRAL